MTVGRPAIFNGIGPNITIVHAVSVAVIAVMALAAYLTLERAIRVQQESATAIGLTERESLLSQRIASFAAQYALGDVAVRDDLRAAITGLASTHRYLVAGDVNAGIRRAGGDTALDSTVAQYVMRARRIAATSPRTVALADSTASFMAAQRPLLAALEDEFRARTERGAEQLSRLRILGATICALSLVTLFAASFAVYRPLARRIVRLMADASELAGVATVDPLTGMLNKRSFQARGAIEIHKARRYGRPLSLLMIDADHLTAIEDTYGSGGGEAMLKALTSSFFGGTRVSDLVARVEAEQFAILLPETDCEGAQLLAERLRHKINDLSVPINNKLVQCTISVGVAAAEKDAAFLWPTFKRADEALYEAKMRGRNRVVVAAAA